MLTYSRPGINVAARIACDWLTGHERYTSGDHVNLTGLTTQVPAASWSDWNKRDSWSAAQEAGATPIS